MEYDELPLLLLHGDLVVEQTPQKIWLHPPLPSQSGHAFYNGDSLSLLLQQKNIDINVIEREFTEDTAISLAIACDNHEGLALLLQQPGWQKLRGSTGGTRRKVWTRTKILSPNIRYFVAK